MVEQEKYFRNKYGSQTLINALVNLIPGIALFMAGIAYNIADEDLMLDAVFASQVMIANAILAFIQLFASGAFRKDTRDRKISSRSRKIMKGILITGAVTQALSGNLSNTVVAANGLKNDFDIMHFKPNKILPIMECFISALTLLLGIMAMTDSEFIQALRLLIGVAIVAAQAIQIITAIASCVACDRWWDTITEINRQRNQQNGQT